MKSPLSGFQSLAKATQASSNGNIYRLQVAVTATRARGATHELGVVMQKLVTAHHDIVKERESQATKLANQVITMLTCNY
jgi:hypothetical protein